MLLVQYGASADQKKELRMLYSLNEAMNKCPGLQEILEKAVDAYQDTSGGWPRSDRVQISIVVSALGELSGESGFATGTVTGLGRLMDETFVDDEN